MEQLVYILEKLEEEKEQLLEKKEDNLQKIDDCERKIDYYKYIIGRYDNGIRLRKNQIKSYNNILEFSEGHQSLFSLHVCDNPMDTYMEDRVDKFEGEIQDIISSKKVICVLISVAKKNQDTLIKSNEQIDLRISEIDAEIKSKDSGQHVKKLERRN